MIYFFDRDMELKKLVVSSNVYNPTHQQVKNGMILAQLEFDIDYAFMFIDKVEYFGYYYNETFYLHRIKTVEPDFADNIMTVAGNHIFFDDMIGYNYIKDIRPDNRDAHFVLNYTIGEATRWEIVMTDVTEQLSSSFYYLTPMEALEQIVKDYQVEYEPRILFDGKKVNAYQLHVANKLGNQDAKRVRFGDKVLQLKYDIDYSDISTAIIGRGKGEEVGDGYGRRIEFTDINFSRNGVVSPIGKNYMEDPRITDLYGYDDGTPKYEIVTFEEIENPRELAEATYNYYVEKSKPKMLFETEVTDIGIKHIGDSLLIVKPENNLVFKVRVEKIDVNLHNPDAPTMELGDYEHFQESKVERKNRVDNENFQGQISDRITRLKRAADERFDNVVAQWWSEYEQALIDVHAQIEADRENMTNLIEGTRTEFTDNLNAEISQTKDYAEQQAQAKADSVQSNLDSFKDSHQQIYDEVNGNIIDINTFLGDKSETLKQQFDKVHIDFSTLENDLSSIESDLSETKTDLTTTKTDLQQQLDDARKTFDELEIGGRNLLIMNNLNLSRHSNTAVDIENGLISGYGSYYFTFENVKMKPDTFYTFSYVSSISNRLSFLIRNKETGDIQYIWNAGTLPPDEKVTFKVPENVLSETDNYHIWVYISGTENIEWQVEKIQLEKGTVATDWTLAPEDTDNKITNINQSITNIEGELSTKVEQTEVDTLKGTVTSQGTLLTQTMGELSSKADKSVVDTLTGRVTDTETTVTQNSEEIAKRLIKSVYDEDKKDTDAKITKWTNTATETAEGLERVIGRVSETENGIETAQTRIETEAGRINGLLTRTSEVEGQVQDARLAIEANADGLALTATKTEVEQAIDELDVGVRNLVIGSGENIYSDAYLVGVYTMSEPWEVEQEYTVVIKGEINEGQRFGIWAAGTGTQATTLTYDSDKDVHISTFTLRSIRVQREKEFRIYNVSSAGADSANVEWVMMVKGNKAPTSHVPAPEDAEIKITKAQADIIANANEISLKASQAELNSATGEISSLAGKLSVQAGEISSVVSKVDGNTQNIAAVVQDTKSITSTVAEIENDLAAQGSEIDQALNSITNKVWLGDVGGKNLLPQTVFPNDSNAWLARGTNVTRHTTTTRGLTDYLWVNRSDGEANRYMAVLSPLLSEEVVEGHEYTIQFKTAHRVNVDDLFRYVYLMNEDGTPNQATPNSSQTVLEIGENDYNGNQIQLHTITIKANFSGRARILIGTYSVNSGAARFYVKEVKIEKGKATAYSRAPEDFLQTSELEITPNYWQLGSTRIDGNSVSSVLRGTPDSIDAIVSEMNLTGNLNVKGQIETIALSAVNADIANLRTSILTANSITSDHLSVSTSMVNKLFSATARIDQLLTKTHFANNIKAMSLDAVDANIGSIRSKLLTTDVILSGHINSSNALIDKIFSSTARFERLMSKTGFITTLNTVTIDTDQLTIRRPDGVAWVSNGVYKFNLEIQRNTFMDPSMTFNGQNYTVPDQYWRTFENAYTFHNGRYITAAFAVSLTSWTAPNSTYIHVRLREFGSGSLSKNFKVLVRKGETSFHNLEIDLGKPDFNTAKNFYLEARMDNNRDDIGGYVRVNRLIIRG